MKNQTSTPSRDRTGTPFRAVDFKSESAEPFHAKHRQNATSRVASEGLANRVPQAVPHPTRGRVSVTVFEVISGDCDLLEPLRQWVCP
jgi:hypothetical protein